MLVVLGGRVVFVLCRRWMSCWEWGSLDVYGAAYMLSIRWNVHRYSYECFAPSYEYTDVISELRSCVTWWASTCSMAWPTGAQSSIHVPSPLSSNDEGHVSPQQKCWSLMARLVTLLHAAERHERRVM